MDPNVYFGTYAALIMIVLISSFFLSQLMEPEIILIKRMKRKQREERAMQRLLAAQEEGDDGAQMDMQESEGSIPDDPLGRTCSKNLSDLCGILKYKELYLFLIYFFITGLLLPNIDDLHYVFLTETIGMPKYTYDFLNTLMFVGLLICTVLFNQLLAGVQVWILILASLVMTLLTTSLVLINAVRLNIEWGISDEVINGFIFFFGTQPISILA